MPVPGPNPSCGSSARPTSTYDFAPDGEATDLTLTLEFPTAERMAEHMGVGMAKGIASSQDQWAAVAAGL